jgi:hypothetical protein
MEKKSNTEDRVNEALESAGKIMQVEVPAFFAERTLNRLRASENRKSVPLYPVLLKVAAVIALVALNTYTIQRITINSKQDVSISKIATVKDFASEYQSNDANALTLETNITHE